ncbi:MAG: cation:proton antiporter [Candidatus Nanopelagicales bacterium]|nr:cation:proton antiporter [Candidatus Nanopelagicales bacterium]
MSQLSEGEIMLAAAVIFGIATLCQVLAPRLKVPALILLLPAGFLLGVIAPQFRVDQILGPAFPVAVNLMVAVILFQGGLELGSISLARTDKNVVRRLVWIGGAITFVGSTLASHFLLDLSWSLAVLLGAILIVSGPTVVTPILNFARPTPRVRGILMWEGTLLDPLGAIFAVVIFQVVRVSDFDRPLEAIVALIGSFTVAIVMAVIGVLLAVTGIKLVRGNALIGTQVLIGTVLFAAGIANVIAAESGLLTALLMGVAARPLATKFGTSLAPAEPFFNTVTSIGIGVLFVTIAALVPSPMVASLAIPAMGVALILILLVRPIVAALCTSRTDLSKQERMFIGWMDPRGIVAAATSSSVAAALVAANVEGADKLLPAAFIIIALTVFTYGLTAVPVATALGIRSATPADDNPPTPTAIH